MIRGGYTSAADNWSLGVILYVLLSGVTPFYGKDQKDILKSIVMGHYTFNLKPFKACSDEVKDLISKLLVQVPEKRYTATQAYNHPWVQLQVDEEIKNIKIPTSVLEGIQALCTSKE
jgi:calcium-dependent protein kinase